MYVIKITGMPDISRFENKHNGPSLANSNDVRNVGIQRRLLPEAPAYCSIRKIFRPREQVG